MQTVKTTITLYLHRKADGSETLYGGDMTNGGDSEFWVERFGVCIGPVEVRCEYETLPGSPVGILVESLEKKIEQEREDSRKKINKMLDKISQLKCLPHDGGDA